MGTSDGHLKKTVVESASSGIEYADIPIAPGILYLEKKVAVDVVSEKIVWVFVSVADPGCLSRIQIFFQSRILGKKFPDPDPHQRI